jgi:hypothetical protein
MDFIYEIENILEPSICKSIIERFENDDNKVRAETNGGYLPGVKLGTELQLVGDHTRKKWSDIISLTCSILNHNLPKYINHIVDISPDEYECLCGTFNFCAASAPQIQKTTKGGFFKWHHDGYKNRILTYIIYLNDVNQEDGGSTDFLLGKSIQPKVGKMVIFPANIAYIHRGNELKNGSKYIMTGFIHDESQ